MEVRENLGFLAHKVTRVIAVIQGPKENRAVQATLGLLGHKVTKMIAVSKGTKDY